MHPNEIVYQDIGRGAPQWEPAPLELPLTPPRWPEPEEDVESDGDSDRGVLIINIDDYNVEFEV